MSFSAAETDMKNFGNNMLLNTGGLLLFNKVLAQYIVNPGDSETIKILKSAALLSSIEQIKSMAQSLGYDLRVFK